MLGDWKIRRTGGGGGRVRIVAVKSIVHTALKLKGVFFFLSEPCVEGGL